MQSNDNEVPRSAKFSWLIILAIFLAVGSIVIFKSLKNNNIIQINSHASTDINEITNTNQRVSLLDYQKEQQVYLMSENVRVSLDLNKFSITNYVVKDRIINKEVDIIQSENSSLFFGLYNKNSDELIKTLQEKWEVEEIRYDDLGYVNSIFLKNSYENNNNVVVNLAIIANSDAPYLTARIDYDKSKINDKSVELYAKFEIKMTEQYKKDNNSVVHSGLVGLVDGKIINFSTSDIKDKSKHINIKSTDWIGYTDRYNMVIMQTENSDYSDNLADKSKDRFLATYQYVNSNSFTGYKINYTLLPNDANLIKLYINSKTADKLKKYKDSTNLIMFDRVLDYGLFYVITKPMSSLLHKIYHYVGDYGVAIIVLTILIRLLTLPMSHMSYKSMNKMKIVQPEIEDIKKAYKDDKAGAQKATFELYRKYKINPLSGCLPILLQIPIFFSIYKVIYITNEMRFEKFLWISDLSSKDPTSLFNLFGVFNYHLPEFLVIGLMPLLMGLTMFFQQKIMPNNMVSSQYANQKVLLYGMPIIFTVMFSSFPSGLVIYWTINNLFGIIHQLILKKIVTK